MSRLAHTDWASGEVVRDQREHPGELVRLDVQKLGRIPDGGGHRAHGRATAAGFLCVALVVAVAQLRLGSRSSATTTSAFV